MKSDNNCLKKIVISLLIFLLSSFSSFFLLWTFFYFDKEESYNVFGSIILSVFESFIHINENLINLPLDIFNKLSFDIRLSYVLQGILFVLLVIGIIWGLKRYFNSSVTIMNIQKLWPFFISIFLWIAWGVLIGLNRSVGGV